MQPSAAGELKKPGALALLGAILYVVDQGNDRIQIFGPDGVFLGHFGDKEGPGRLDTPGSLAISPQGEVLVLDEGSRSIKVYDRHGLYRRTLTPTAEPVGLAADHEGFFVADEDHYRVCKYDYDGTSLDACFGSRGKGRSQFLAFIDLAFGPQGDIYVADPKKEEVQVVAAARTAIPLLDPVPSLPYVTREATVKMGEPRAIAWGKRGLLYAINGKNESVFALRDGDIVSQFNQKGWEPVAVAEAPDQSVWIIDADEEQLLHFSAEGELLGRFSDGGSRTGYLDDPEDLVINREGMIFVADSGNERIQVFNGSGSFLQLLDAGPIPLKHPVALTLDDFDTLHVLDDEQRRVYLFAADGSFISSFPLAEESLEQPLDMVAGDEIAILDAVGRIALFDTAGNFQRYIASAGHAPGQLDNPVALARAGRDTLYVASDEISEIQGLKLHRTPAAPTVVKSRAQMRKVSLTWAANSEPFVSGYHLYRRSSVNEPFVEIATPPNPSFTDSDVEPGKIYQYRVSAQAREGNESAWAPQVEAVPLKVTLDPPTELTATPQEWAIDLNWSPSGSPYFSHYIVSRLVDGEPQQLGETTEPLFYEGMLDPETSYDYLVSTVSSDGVVGSAAPITVITVAATRPPLEIEVLHLDNIFSNSYKVYENDGVGRVKISNNTTDPISKLRLLFFLKDFMDYPSEVSIDNLAPRSSQEVTLKAVFNNRILDITEDTPIQAEITAIHFRNAQEKRYETVQSLTIYEKHRLMWDMRERFAAFITPKDPTILDFARAVATPFADNGSPLLYGGVLFDALGVLGVRYMQDPSNPYQATSGQTDFVDYIQYPQETLSRKSGDCDDLVGLYTSLLESLGIHTMIVEVPGHMFMMYDSGLEVGSVSEMMSALYIEHDEKLWIPVEVTLVSSPFISAWEKGSQGYHEHQQNGNLTLLDPRKAWESFKPASLAATTWRPELISREQLEENFPNELTTLRRIRIRNIGKQYLDILQEAPEDAEALLQYGIINAKSGEIDEAVRHIEKAAASAPDNAAIANALGNVRFMSDDLEAACDAYTEAVRLEPSDPRLLISLARCQQRLGQRENAATTFRQACNIDKRLRIEYRSLALELGAIY
ncbi:MAG: hypothetical protein C0621_00035 [Desulfuromonas sp.]|nr:MAG: hypothetical protein C0621_00035 [Desulfuromonas sp.]